MSEGCYDDLTNCQIHKEASMDFVIDRAKWRCGGGWRQRGKGLTMLQNTEGYMCCLGQFCDQLGVPDLEGLYVPSDVPEYRNTQIRDVLVEDGGIGPEGPWFNETRFSDLAIGINDNRSISDQEREKELTELCIRHGHTLRFEGEYGSGSGTE
jgi:hypothetical protein